MTPACLLHVCVPIQSKGQSLNVFSVPVHLTFVINALRSPCSNLVTICGCLFKIKKHKYNVSLFEDCRNICETCCIHKIQIMVIRISKTIATNSYFIKTRIIHTWIQIVYVRRTFRNKILIIDVRTQKCKIMHEIDAH